MPELLEKIQKATKKIPNGFSQEADEPILFFTDQEILKAFDHDMNPVIQAGNVFLNSYLKATGFKIETIDSLNAFGKNPEAFYKNLFYKANEKDFDHLTKLKLDFASMISIPENFSEVINCWNKFNRYFQNKPANFFTIEAGKLELTQAAYEKRDLKAYLKATTPEEKERLKISSDILKAMEQLEPLLKREKNMQGAIEHKLYFHPLPYQLKRIPTTDGWKIIPNPSWVEQSWGGTNFLGHYLLSIAEKRQARRDAMPEFGPKWIKFYRKMKTGGEQLFTCPESEYEKHKIPTADRLVPGFFTEAGDEWGVKIDRTKSRAVKETKYSPINFGLKK